MSAGQVPRKNGTRITPTLAGELSLGNWMSSRSTMLTGQSSWDCASISRPQGIQPDLMAVHAQADACLVVVLVLLSAPDIVWWVGNSGPVLEGATLQAPGQGCVLPSRPVQADSQIMRSMMNSMKRFPATEGQMQNACQVKRNLAVLEFSLCNKKVCTALVMKGTWGLVTCGVGDATAGGVFSVGWTRPGMGTGSWAG